MSIQYDYIHEILPKEIFFVTTRELEEMFPDNTTAERVLHCSGKELSALCRFDKLECGEPHDGRQTDYDDLGIKRRHRCILSGSRYCTGAFLYGYSV